MWTWTRRWMCFIDMWFLLLYWIAHQVSAVSNISLPAGSTHTHTHTLSSIWDIQHFTTDSVCRPQMWELIRCFVLRLVLAHFIQLSWNAWEIQDLYLNAQVWRCCQSSPFLNVFQTCTHKCFVWGDPWLVSMLVMQCDSWSYACKFYFFFFFFFKRGGKQLCKCHEREGKIYGFVIYFQYFYFLLVFANYHLHLYE